MLRVLLCFLLETQPLESIKDKMCRLLESKILGLNSDVLFDFSVTLQYGFLSQNRAKRCFLFLWSLERLETGRTLLSTENILFECSSCLVCYQVCKTPTDYTALICALNSKYVFSTSCHLLKTISRFRMTGRSCLFLHLL